MDIDYLQVAGVYEPGREKKAGGYVLFSVGATIFDPDESGAGAFCSGGCIFAFSGSGMFQLELSAGLAIAF